MSLPQRHQICLDARDRCQHDSISLHLLALFGTASILRQAFPLWLKDDCSGSHQLQIFENEERLLLVVPVGTLLWKP